MRGKESLGGAYREEKALKFLPAPPMKTGLNSAALALGFSCSGNVRFWPEADIQITWK